MEQNIASLLLRNSHELPDKNLCFANAAIQVLRNIPEFKENIFRHPNHSVVQNDLRNILKYENTNQTVSASILRENLGKIYSKKDYITGRQCDSLEFLEYLLHNTHPNIKSLFEFKVKTERKYLLNSQLTGCQFCGLFPPISEEEDVVLKLGFPENDYECGVPLQQLIDSRFSYIATEQEHGMRCPNCCKHENSSPMILENVDQKLFFLKTN